MYTDFSLMLIIIRLQSVKLRVRISICIVRNHSLLKSGSPCDWLTSISCRSAVIQLLNYPSFFLFCFLSCVQLLFLYCTWLAQRSDPSRHFIVQLMSVIPVRCFIKYKIMTSQQSIKSVCLVSRLVLVIHKLFRWSGMSTARKQYSVSVYIN